MVWCRGGGSAAAAWIGGPRSKLVAVSRCGFPAAGTELDGPAIARELMVSLNTMRTHTKNIYAKLAVTSRRAAVRRAAELGLLPRNRSRQP